MSTQTKDMSPEALEIESTIKHATELLNRSSKLETAELNAIRDILSELEKAESRAAFGMQKAAMRSTFASVISSVVGGISALAVGVASFQIFPPSDIQIVTGWIDSLWKLEVIFPAIAIVVGSMGAVAVAYVIDAFRKRAASRSRSIRT